MDLDHAASLLPLALGVLAALVTVYPPNGRHRHLWAVVFVAAGVLTSVVIWFAVNSSQRFQENVLTSLTGGKNYCYLYPTENRLKPNKEFGFVAVMQNDTPLFDVDIYIYTPTSPEEREAEASHKTQTQFEKMIYHTHFEILKDKFTPIEETLGVGNYSVFITQRNGEIDQDISIFKQGDGVGIRSKATLRLIGGGQPITVLDRTFVH